MKKRKHKLYGKRLKNHIQALVRAEIRDYCGDDPVYAFHYCLDKIEALKTEYWKGANQIMIDTALSRLNEKTPQ